MKTALVLGLGLSGLAAARFLEEEGYHVFVYDKQATSEMYPQLSFKDLKKQRPFFDIIVKSPGLKSSAAIVHFCRLLTFDLTNDIELAYRYLPKHSHIIAVTGTNGKTTLVTFIGQILQQFTPHVYMLGNIGLSPLDVIKQIPENSYLIFELSSYQIETLQAFHPEVVCLTNIAKNHLDVVPYYYYQASKTRLLRRLNKHDHVFFHQEATSLIDGQVLAKQMLTNEQDNRFYYLDDMLFYQRRFLKNISDIPLTSHHDRLHLLMALNVVRLYYDDIDGFLRGITHLKTVPFREQYLGQFANFTIINDAKSSNVDATNTVLDTFKDKRRLIIVGGINKSKSFRFLKVNEDDLVFAYGRDGMKIIADLARGVYYPTLKEVLTVIHHDIRDEVYLLYSPGCSSFDQFANYVARGNYFNDLVEEIFNARK